MLSGTLRAGSDIRATQQPDCSGRSIRLLPRRSIPTLREEADIEPADRQVREVHKHAPAVAIDRSVIAGNVSRSPRNGHPTQSDRHKNCLETISRRLTRVCRVASRAAKYFPGFHPPIKTAHTCGREPTLLLADDAGGGLLSLGITQRWLATSSAIALLGGSAAFAA